MKKLILGLAIFLSCEPSLFANGVEISRERLMDIVRGEATRLGYKLEEMELDLDGAERRWNEYVAFLTAHEMHEDSKRYLDTIRSRLANKKYRVAYLHPNEPLTLGGDLFIFVDAFSGDVLANFRGR